MQNNYWNNLKKRYLFIQVFIFAFFIIFILRSYQLFFHSPIPSIERSKKDTIRRGIIFDSHNNELAISRQKISLSAATKEIIDPEQTAFLLSKITRLPEAEILEKINGNEKFVRLKNKITVEEAEEIQILKLSGIVVDKEQERFYPNGSLAAPLMGFVGFDHEGLEGIEYQFNEILTQKNEDTFSGLNLHLTIDAYIQHKLEQNLNTALLKTKGKKAAGIITEVQTGKILAMASVPSFNPNDPFFEKQKRFKNLAITETYEPGSTFKIFILSALLSEKKVDTGKTYFCPGYFESNGTKVNCGRIHGKQTLKQAIKNSCNSIIIQAVWNLPVFTLYENLVKFGLTAKTGINLPGESKGNFPHPKNWGNHLKMTIPIGHGLSVTPLQLIKAANIIGNDGEMVKPYIIEKISRADGKIVEEFLPDRPIRVISEDNSKIILNYMTSVVQKGGTGEEAAIAELDISGKTGTSLKSDNTGYDKDKVQASFLGFFPGNRPQISVLIWIDEPEGELRQGGKAAAPVFREVLNEIITLVSRGDSYKINNLPKLPYGEKEYVENIMPNFMGKSKKEVLFILKNHFEGDHVLQGSGYVSKQFPAKGSKIKKPYEFILFFKGQK